MCFYDSLGCSRGSGRGKSMLVLADKVGRTAARCCAAGYGWWVEIAITIELLPLDYSRRCHSS